MISIILQGGLGNQLFQVAAAASLANKINTELILSSNNHILNLQGNKVLNYRSNIFSKIKFIEDNNFFKNFQIYNEPFFTFKEIPYKDNIFLNGYFQTEKYFVSDKEYIKNLFCETEYIKTYINKKYKDINFKNSVSLHVRRGDYLKFPDIHPVCDIRYYQECISLIGKYSNLLVFSDDLEWCKDNLNYKNIIFIENESDYIDLYLMSRCKNNIIANSTFSWWGAWLNNNDNKKVFCPSEWFGPKGPQDFKDIFCEGWNVI